MGDEYRKMQESVGGVGDCTGSEAWVEEGEE